MNKCSIGNCSINDNTGMPMILSDKAKQQALKDGLVFKDKSNEKVYACKQCWNNVLNKDIDSYDGEYEYESIDAYHLTGECFIIVLKNEDWETVIKNWGKDNEL